MYSHDATWTTFKFDIDNWPLHRKNSKDTVQRRNERQRYFILQAPVGQDVVVRCNIMETWVCGCSIASITSSLLTVNPCQDVTGCLKSSNLSHSDATERSYQ